MLKSGKRGVFWSTGPRKLTWQGSDVARRWRGARDHRRMRRGSEATWQGRGWPTWRMGDVSYILYNIHNISLFIRTGWWHIALPYLSARYPAISSVWDYVPTWFLFCRWRGRVAGVRSSRLWSQGVDRVDRSPRERQIKHVLQMGVSGSDQTTHL